MAALNSEFEAPLEADRLAKSLQMVRQEMADACKKAGRGPAEVTLVAVTKTVSQQTCNDLVRLGCLDLAENRPQVLWDKTAHVIRRSGGTLLVICSETSHLEPCRFFTRCTLWIR
ncbi:MAG: hypothetical protein ACKO9Q_06390 [Pirellula sp.]